MNNAEKIDSFIGIAAREHAELWVKDNVTADEGTCKVAVVVVAAKIEEIARDPANEGYGFRKAGLYLKDCKFENSQLVHTPSVSQ